MEHKVQHDWHSRYQCKGPDGRYIPSIYGISGMLILILFLLFSPFKCPKLQSHFPCLFIEMPFHSQSNIIAAYSILRPSKCHCKQIDISPLILYEISDRQYGIDWVADDLQCVFCALTFCIFLIQIPMEFALLIPIRSLSSLFWFGWVFLDVLIHFGVSDVGSHLNSHKEHVPVLTLEVLLLHGS